jgi:hypothetical protein
MEISGQLHAYAPSPSGRELPVPTEWTPEPVWTLWRREEELINLPGNGTRTIQPVAHPNTN